MNITAEVSKRGVLEIQIIIVYLFTTWAIKWNKLIHTGVRPTKEKGDAERRDVIGVVVVEVVNCEMTSGVPS